MDVAQGLMVLTLLLMVTGKAPIYLTAIIGSTIAALVAGFPLAGKAEITILKLINGGLNPVIADMAGVLMFIGIMTKIGFLDVIIHKIMQIGSRIGGAAGITAAGSLVAGIIGALTGFTQPAVTAVVTGPAAIKLGQDPNKTAGLAAHAGHFGNFAGFTHPTQVAVVATAAIGFGKINVVGAIVGLSIIWFSYMRLRREAKCDGRAIVGEQQAAVEKELASKSTTTATMALLPFILFVLGFVLGYPVFLVGIIAAIFAAMLGKVTMGVGEAAMLEGVAKIATPLVATIGFLYMSGVMSKIGLVKTISDLLGPIVSISPVFVMLFVSSITGFLTQSNAASVAIVVPFLKVVLSLGADPLAAACAAAGGSAVWQYFLTGGPVAALSTVIAVVPGSDLKKANKFQRPAMVFGFIILFVCVAVVNAMA
ncbi:MAG: hypothetical protein PHR07_06350 [Acidaminococcaceae bacterium]|nr:hypothetical protein [Acidaminococcaceae bacterium]